MAGCGFAGITDSDAASPVATIYFVAKKVPRANPASFCCEPLVAAEPGYVYFAMAAAVLGTVVEAWIQQEREAGLILPQTQLLVLRCWR